IHYNETATRREGHADLLVHGPLTSTLLLDHFHRKYVQAEAKRGNDVVLKSFEYRALHPLLNDQPFVLAGEIAKEQDKNHTCRLWAANPKNIPCMAGTLVFETTPRQ